MKKHLIASLVGAVIIFVWQFLSWSVLNVHGAETAYSASQDTILQVLSQHLEEGEYFLPTVPPGTPSEEYQAVMEKNIGQPWATINYHPQMEMGMAMNLIRGFVVDFVALWLLTWILLKFADLNFTRALLASWAVGAIGYLTLPYLNSIWFEGSTIGDLIDTVVQWGAVGAWLGWYLNR
jgi:uncharacterized membrane protein YeaQ/YmgE (transglycosylase-associated protein family)